MAIDSSIIIPALNNTELTIKCINSIIQLTQTNEYEIILVDNGSGPVFIQDISKLLKSYPQINLIRNETNLGFSCACNQGALKARGKYIVFLNNDTEIIHGNWLEKILEPLKTDKDTLICGAKLIYPDKKIQHAGVGFYRGNPIHLYRNKKSNYPAANQKKYLNAVTAACLSMRKIDFIKAGLFDENFRNGFEDIDLCLRIIEAGKKILFNHECELIHYEEKTKGRKDYDGYNFHLLLSKHSNFPNDLKNIFNTDGLKIKKWIATLPFSGKFAGYYALLLDRGFLFFINLIRKKLFQRKK